MTETVLDCDAGRALGCASFCCRLIVRLQPGERVPGQPEGSHKSCVDKDAKTGLCVFFEARSARCTVWDARPALCREYDCNRDPLLQVVLRDGYRSLVALVQAPPQEVSAAAHVPALARARGPSHDEA